MGLRLLSLLTWDLLTENLLQLTYLESPELVGSPQILLKQPSIWISVNATIPTSAERLPASIK